VERTQALLCWKAEKSQPKSEGQMERRPANESRVSCGSRAWAAGVLVEDAGARPTTSSTSSERYNCIIRKSLGVGKKKQII